MLPIEWWLRADVRSIRQTRRGAMRYLKRVCYVVTKSWPTPSILWVHSFCNRPHRAKTNCDRIYEQSWFGVIPDRTHPLFLDRSHKAIIIRSSHRIECYCSGGDDPLLYYIQRAPHLLTSTLLSNSQYLNPKTQPSTSTLIHQSKPTESLSKSYLSHTCLSSQPT